MIKIYFDIPGIYISRARYAFTELALRIGIPFRYIPDRFEAHIIYEKQPSNQEPEKIIIPFNERLYFPETICETFKNKDGYPIFTNSGNFSDFDLIGSAFRLLTYLDEQQINEGDRNNRGIFFNNSLPEGRKLSAAVPFLEIYASIIYKELSGLFPSEAAKKISKFPQDKKYALSVSHDVDSLYLNALPEITTNFIKLLTRRDSQFLRASISGLKFIGRNDLNPFFTLIDWQQWEQKRNLKSIFYLYFRPKNIKLDLNDCKSGVHDKTDWKKLKEMADRGWEFGLHASINTRFAENGFKESKTWLENHLGRTINGLRHHYWALDWIKPYKSHKQHSDAGFLFDSSIAWRNSAGFRAGTSLPYVPFNPETEEEINLLEIPCNLMDGHVLDDSIANPEERFRDALEKGENIIKEIKQAGGLIVLNWHSETFCESLRPVYLKLLSNILAPLSSDTDLWIASPSEIYFHWKQYMRKILP